ncbi:MAG: hypothetical protein QG620_246 [Patescibacteria group bacterium]|nr:hypothetical protein [Patescibacteria group bacterium]
MKDKIVFFIKYFLPAFLWAGLVFYFSNIPSLEVGAPSLSWEIIIRKAAHIGEYAVLAWLIFRVFHKGLGVESYRRAFGLSLLVVISYAISDEIHQSVVPGRAGKFVDVAIDSLGAFLGLIMAGRFYGFIQTKRKTALFLSAVFLVFGIVFQMAEDGKEIENQKEAQSEDVSLSGSEQNNFLENAKEKAEESLSKLKNAPEENPERETDLPKKISIKVPFTPQAPFANWDAYHEDACEEASLIMLKHYLDGKPLDKDTAEKEILGLVEFQNKNYGDFKDTNAKETVKLAKDYYGIDNLKVVYDFSKDDLKKILAKGKPIIIPAAGRKLGNPNYSGLGPLYHVLVLTGYDGNNVITNDPGTRKGEGYKYNINVFYDAIHDLQGSPENIEQGRKAMIVVE